MATRTHNFQGRRDFAQAFGWHEAQSGARVTVARHGRCWTVTVTEPAADNAAEHSTNG